MTSIPPTTAEVQGRLKPFLVDADPNLATPDKKMICREIALDIAMSTSINAKESIMSPTILDFQKKVSAITAGNLSTPVKDDLLFRVSTGLVNGAAKAKPTENSDKKKQPGSGRNGMPTRAPSDPPSNTHAPGTQSYTSLALAQHELGPDFKALCGDKLLKKTNMVSKVMICRHEPSCGAKVVLEVPCDGLGVVSVKNSGVHSHPVATWLEGLMDGWKTGLPPLVKEYDDDKMPEMNRAGMGPRDVWRTVNEHFHMHPLCGGLFSNPDRRARMSSKISNYWKGRKKKYKDQGTLRESSLHMTWTK